ncbi:Uncharacterised protein [Dermatophilus congolensis]|uniref:DUF4352 domain-containing protein n=2 Tax=Dermatophilus congolensis TaxID=1863 RepID=A0A239V5S8_9MICO|nr:Uncharacterised protein [Dermatophilus congolensis]
MGRMRSRALCSGATALVLIFSATACAGIAPARPETAASAPAANNADKAPVEEPTKNTPAAFGQKATWNGIDVTLSQPAAFTPSGMASYPKGSKQFVSVNYTLTNTSDKPLETMYFRTATDPNGETGTVADSANGIGSPTTAIEPGQSLSWKEAYPMNETLKLKLTWQPPGVQPHSETLNLDKYPGPKPAATPAPPAPPAPGKPPAAAPGKAPEPGKAPDAPPAPKAPNTGADKITNPIKKQPPAPGPAPAPTQATASADTAPKG